MTALSRMTSRPSRFALGWFLASVAVAAAAGLCGRLLAAAVGDPRPSLLPAVFLASTALLAVVSGALARAEVYAKREKQPRLRAAIAAALAAAALFLAVQGTALWGLLGQMMPDDTAIGPRAFVFVAVALHALHAAAALLWLVYVALRGFAGGYDHEYRFGLTACGWCWHLLGIVWLAILTVFLAAVG
ncbi:MAG TPA: cytochrome c oxidase subunit 3 [Planctomycetaceae bacterium]